MVNIKRLLYSKFGNVVISILLGLGLATLFRKVCNDRNCLLFKGPNLSNIRGKTFKYNEKCYKYKENATTCDKTKKIIDFA
tara:strand:+ start:3347 stop:3589 length:243 start_codon:yes stop_codon:yes gene_type:complete